MENLLQDTASGYDDFCSYGKRKDGADAEG